MAVREKVFAFGAGNDDVGTVFAGKVFSAEGFAVRLDGLVRECVPVFRRSCCDAETEVFLLVGTGRKKTVRIFPRTFMPREKSFYRLRSFLLFLGNTEVFLCLSRQSVFRRGPSPFPRRPMRFPHPFLCQGMSPLG